MLQKMKDETFGKKGFVADKWDSSMRVVHDKIISTIFPDDKK